MPVFITDDKGNIRAQSYAWLAGEGKKNEKATSMYGTRFI